MNKKYSLLLLIIFLAIAGIAMGVYLVKQRQSLSKKATPSTTIYFQPATSQATVGQTVNLDIFVETGGNLIYSLIIEVDYDNQILEAQSLTFTSLLPNLLSPSNISSGKVTASAGTGTSNGTANPPVSGTQKVATVSFKVLNPTAKSIVSFGPATSAYTGLGTDVGANLITQKISSSIIALAQTTSTSSTPTATSVPTTSSFVTPTATPTIISVATPTPITSTSTPTPVSITTASASTPTPTPTSVNSSLYTSTSSTSTSTPTDTPIPTSIIADNSSSPTPTSSSSLNSGLGSSNEISSSLSTTPTPPVTGNTLPTFSLLGLGGLLVLGFFLVF